MRTEHGTVYGPKTEQGTLAVFNGAYDRNEYSTTHYIRPSEATAVYTGGEQRAHFTLHYLYQAVARIPAKGKADLIGWESRLVGADT